MPKHKSITTAAAQRIKLPKSGQVDHFDSSLPGLALRVSSSGRKTWVYFYRHAGKLRRMSFDVFPAMSVAAAHQKWLEARDLVQAGRDPGRVSQVGATDFDGVAEEWLRRDQEGNRSAKVVARMLQREVLPKWGHRQISDISRRDARDLIDAIVDRGHPTMARNFHTSLHRLFKWAKGRDIIDANPFADMEKPGGAVRRDRVLTDEELVKVWRASDQLGAYGPAIKLLILTGARREEIAKLRRNEIDGNFITLSGERTKNGEPHIIPLSTAALSVLGDIQQGDGFVFAAGLPDWSHSKKKLDKLAEIQAWHIHDLRRTAATGLQRLGIALQVTEAVLGHTGGSRAGIIGVYQRHDYAAEKRAALEAWGAHVMALVEGREPGKVVAFGVR